MEQIIELINRQRQAIKENLSDPFSYSDTELGGALDYSKSIKELFDGLSSLEQLIVFHYYYGNDTIIIESSKVALLLSKLSQLSFTCSVTKNELMQGFSIIKVDWSKK